MTHFIKVRVQFILLRVSLVIEVEAYKIWGICLDTSIISRHTLGCSHWWEFVYTETDITLCCQFAMFKRTTQIYVIFIFLERK